MVQLEEAYLRVQGNWNQIAASQMENQTHNQVDTEEIQGYRYKKRDWGVVVISQHNCYYFSPVSTLITGAYSCISTIDI